MVQIFAKGVIRQRGDTSIEDAWPRTESRIAHAKEVQTCLFKTKVIVDDIIITCIAMKNYKYKIAVL